VKLPKEVTTMSLVRWDPFRELNRWADLVGLRGEMPAPVTAWNPAVDIFENENEIVIKAELPGMEAKDIEIGLENNVLTMKGERHFEKEAKEENYHRVEREYGRFSRSFSLPLAVKEDKVTAEFKNGLLRIVLPKKEEIKPKAIKIAA
jgi:HSP20 family protein